MNSKEISDLMNCKTIEEASIKAELMGIDFNRKQFELYHDMEDWERTIKLYRLYCKERGIGYTI